VGGIVCLVGVVGCYVGVVVLGWVCGWVFLGLVWGWWGVSLPLILDFCPPDRLR